MKIAILGDSLVAISTAHSLLDQETDAEVHLFTERPEIGLMNEGPGIFEKWPPCPNHWISDLKSQEPSEGSNSVRRSWFEKAIAIALSERGCIIHLRTRCTDVSSGHVEVKGAGRIGSGRIPFDIVSDMRSVSETSTEWSGGVCITGGEPKLEITGNRSDGTTELWWSGPRKDTGSWLQEMKWIGEDPRESLTSEIKVGIEIARTLVDTIIQKSPGHKIE